MINDNDNVILFLIKNAKIISKFALKGIVEHLHNSTMGLAKVL